MSRIHTGYFSDVALLTGSIFRAGTAAKMAAAGALAANTNTNNSEDGNREQSEEVVESKRDGQKAPGKVDRQVYRLNLCGRDHH